MRVLVTGITGFIGYSLAKKLAEMGYEVYGTSRIRSTSVNVPEGVSVLTCDLTDYYNVIKVVEMVKPHVVMHVAALTPVSESFSAPVTYMMTNAIGTIHLTEALRKYNYEYLKLFIFAGTTEMFDTSDKITPRTPFEPTSPYSVSKISAHYYLKYLYNTYNFPYVTVVPTNTYGRAFVKQKHFVIEKLITSMLEGKKRILMGNPDSIRDFMFREDHVDAYISILKKFEEGKDLDSIIAKMFTFGTGKGYKIREVAEKIKELIGWEGEIVWNVFIRPNEPKKIVVDYTESEKVLGWRPKYDLESGLRKAIEEWKAVLGL